MENLSFCVVPSTNYFEGNNGSAAHVNGFCFMTDLLHMCLSGCSVNLRYCYLAKYCHELLVFHRST